MTCLWIMSLMLYLTGGFLTIKVTQAASWSPEGQVVSFVLWPMFAPFLTVNR